VKYVLVEFWDHCEADTATWTSLEEATACEPALMMAVGFLVCADARKVVLTQAHVPGEDTVAKPFVLVASTVIQISELAAVTNP
jgi:hypothetical protein